MHHNSYNNRDYGGHQSGYGGHSSPHSQSYSSGPSPHHMPSHHPGMLPPPQYNSMIMVAGETIPTRPDEISRSLPIPEYKIGWIIGKRGSYINQLAKKSGASISISDSSSKEYGTVWKYVQIRGSGRAVDRAKKLLHIRLERLEPRPVEEGEVPGGHKGGEEGLGEEDLDGDLIDGEGGGDVDGEGVMHGGYGGHPGHHGGHPGHPGSGYGYARGGHMVGGGMSGGGGYGGNDGYDKPPNDK